jgi:hypothetical protein
MVSIEEVCGTTSFFKAMSPILTANILTVAFIYAFVKIHQKDVAGVEEGRSLYLGLAVFILLLVGYGFCDWDL